MMFMEPGTDELCANCGHRYAVHAGIPGSACVKGDRSGHRCACKTFERVRTITPPITIYELQIGEHEGTPGASVTSITRH